MYFTVSVDFYSEDTLSCVLGLDTLRFSSWQCFFWYCFFLMLSVLICAEVRSNWLTLVWLVFTTQRKGKRRRLYIPDLLNSFSDYRHYSV